MVLFRVLNPRLFKEQMSAVLLGLDIEELLEVAILDDTRYPEQLNEVPVKVLSSLLNKRFVGVANPLLGRELWEVCVIA